jgi:hypothetical protein
VEVGVAVGVAEVSLTLTLLIFVKERWKERKMENFLLFFAVSSMLLMPTPT